MSPCSNGLFNAFFYWRGYCSNDEDLYLPPAEFELDCNFQCPEGQKLGVVDEDGDALIFNSQCVDCPKNTYSLGGDFVVDGDVF